jgi:dynein heavy chain
LYKPDDIVAIIESVKEA